MDDKKGKCPNCGEVITMLNVARITLNDDHWGSKNGHSYSCPSCQVVLCAGFDPDTFIAEIQRAVETTLRKH
jgi:predicted RNA-binding Zn-ribbon protein involved in translation (DUF1610 family)